MTTTDLLLKYKKYVGIPPVIAAVLYVYFLRSFSSSRRRRQLSKSVSSSSSSGAFGSDNAADSQQQVDGGKQSLAMSAGGDKKVSSKSSARVGVNARFFAQMNKLVPILVPSVFSRESALLVSLAAVLIARTWLDIWFSSFNGVVVKSIVSRDRRAFVARAGVEFSLMMWPLSIVNNSLKMLINALSICFRDRLTTYAHEAYLSDITFYKVSNIDNRIQNADQLLTQDIDKFSENLAHLYSDISKPLVDIFLFAIKLGQAIGGESPLIMVSYFLASGVFLRVISPPFGKYTAQEQKLEGDFRFTHSRIITHAEEIAFYRGSEREKTFVNQSFRRILEHLYKVNVLRFANGILDSVAVKYCATILAYWLLSRPVFDPRYATEQMGNAGDDPTKIMEDYSRNSSYLVNLSQAVGRVILAGRDLTRFAGYTSRVAELFEVLEDVKRGRYERSMVNDTSGAQLTRVEQSDLKGVIKKSDNADIEFDKVPIITPNGDVLIESLSINCKHGTSVLVTGPNGSGKSSLFRILGELWPLFGGTLTKPEASQFFYVPQKPYLCLGSLRDQLLYPHDKETALKNGVTDYKLMELLKMVHLEYLVDREGGWDAVQDWADVLSGGEKQRMAMGRLFYHKPLWAVLDECTSAVSIDVEGLMYTKAKELGITLFTVSHRTSLFKYHEYLLKFDGNGQYEFSKLEQGDTSSPFAFTKLKQ
ncbi:hypothetical protein MP228_005738 [Amoeboaphelidium protococcarum]|nr:hypothetical protein MP228_005738 [Amoeboaphelidium protococcarum]